MIEFTLWDIARNLMLAARWTLLLSLIAFVMDLRRSRQSGAESTA